MPADPAPQNLPAVIPGAAALPALPQPSWTVDLEEPHVPLAHYLWIIRRHCWKILAFILGSLALTLIVSLRLTPIYESTATVDIDRRTPTGIVGEEAVQSLYNDADQFLATQVKLIQSDSVLRPVALKYKLLERDEESLGLGASPAARDPESPILLKKLKVTRPPNTYLLQISYRSPDRQLAADVANAVAVSYLEHAYNIRYRAAAGLSRFMEKQLEELRAKMELSSDALARYEKELNIINPEEKTNILSARLLEINSEFTKAQADRVAKQAAFASIESPSLEAALVSTQGDSLRKLTEDYNAARQKFAEIRVHFGPNHPEYLLAQAHLNEVTRLLESTAASIRDRVRIEYREALDRERMLEQAVKSTKAELDSLNARSFEYQALKREAEGDKKLYEELLRKIKEATINSSFQHNAARIADTARPARKPVFPNLPLNLMLAFLFSSLLAVGLAILGDVLDDTVRDPEHVSRSLRTEVVGSLPEVRPWRGQLATVVPSASGNGRPSSASSNGHHSLTTYEEAIRTLRNSILLADFDRRLGSLLVTSASPSEGKSTIAIHLAIAHAQQSQRTLLIDGDLRRPSVHKRFGLHSVRGLSDVLTDAGSWNSVVLSPEAVPGLDILPAGSVSPRRAADLIGPGLARIIEEASEIYDLIVVDSPPLLGFPEPLQMAAAVDGVIIATRAGETSRKAVASVLSTLNRLRANVVGVVLNEVTRKMGDRYYYYYGYGYHRRYYSNRPVSH